MKTYMSVAITNFGMDSQMNYGFIYVSDPSCKLEMNIRVSYEAAVKELAKLAKRLNKAPTFSTNPYDPSISYRELNGFLE